MIDDGGDVVVVVAGVLDGVVGFASVLDAELISDCPCDCP